MSKDQDVGTLGDSKITKNTVISHDQVKRRCQRFFTKLMLDSSPKELADYFFELCYSINEETKEKIRLDLLIEKFDEKYPDKDSTK
jgi:hypothetical protein